MLRDMKDSMLNYFLVPRMSKISPTQPQGQEKLSFSSALYGKKHLLESVVIIPGTEIDWYYKDGRVLLLGQ